MSRGPRVNSEGLHIPNTVEDMISSRSFQMSLGPTADGLTLRDC